MQWCWSNINLLIQPFETCNDYLSTSPPCKEFTPKYFKKIRELIFNLGKKTTLDGKGDKYPTSR